MRNVYVFHIEMVDTDVSEPITSKTGETGFHLAIIFCLKKNSVKWAFARPSIRSGTIVRVRLKLISIILLCKFCLCQRFLWNLYGNHNNDSWPILMLLVRPFYSVKANENKWRRVIILLRMSGQGCPTPIHTQIPTPHSQSYSRSIQDACFFTFQLDHYQRTDRRTDGWTKTLIELRVCN